MASYAVHATPPARADVTRLSHADHAGDEPAFAGRGRALQAMLRSLDLFGPHDQLPILIEGETGTGKSYAARALHLRSPRARGVFHQVVLSALDDSLASSDLFGHVAGAYTDARHSRPGHFVSASHGTLFLDEIGKASAAVQRKLLHAVEHHEVWPVGADRALRVNVRLVAATSVPLDELVARGEFLPDLASRLRSFRIRVPALRDRREDIPDLARQFVAVHGERFGYRDALPRLSAGLLDVLQRADWPYNLRQLDGAVQRILVHAEGDATLRPEHYEAQSGEAVPEPFGGASRRRSTAGATRRLMDDLGCATDVARVLGVSRTTVYRHLRQIYPAASAVEDV